MIEEINGIFYLNTKDTSYIFKVSSFSHLEHIYYGEKLPDKDISGLIFKRSAIIGSSVVYDESDENYCLDIVPLEYSGIGKGDYRHSPIEIKMPDGTYTSDFIYVNYKIEKGFVKSETLPTAYGEEDECESLIITLKDKLFDINLKMIYTVYYESNVITRRVIIENNEEKSICIKKIMSLMLDIAHTDFKMLTLDGGWIKEAHKHERNLSYGLYINKSTTGASSNRHNPGIILSRNDFGENIGEVYGFNLIYSGNHYEAVEVNMSGTSRVMCGINPECFEWELSEGESFETPEGVMTYSNEGHGKLSENFHNFVNSHIVRTEWKGKERPVLMNSWEAYFFKFTRGKLLKTAKRAKALGMELFVLDDGWFGKRNDDKAGLGDYNINKKKLPFGLKELVNKINNMGLMFGIWVEPEMVNEDSDLYRNHPDWAVKIEGRKASYGRNQLVLDLCRKEVRDYIVENLRELLSSCNIKYIKWDMNRHISDFYSPSIKNQGEFFHKYILGLYEILNRVFCDRQDILLETCSSGGNRFDLGMLCYSPQIWASDNTDPIERLKIQDGLSYFYPQSTVGAHVSEAPHQQTLRNTPLSTRFNVSSFGSLGYELDLKYLSRAERKEIKEDISFYKQHRNLFQYGRLYRYINDKENFKQVSVVAYDKSTAAVGLYQTITSASPENDILKIDGLNDDFIYTIKTVPQGVNIKRFGNLINFLLPIKLDSEGFLVKIAAKLYMLPDGIEEYQASGKMLKAGIKLNNQFMGTGYNDKIRMLSDFGSQLYIINKIS